MPPQTISLRQLNRATLARQGLLEPLPKAPIARQVQRIGSLQAQHPDWPPFAFQARLAPNAPRADLSRARARKSIVRATLMRLTVHVVSADDFWPMSTLALPLRSNQWRILYKQDPVTSRLGRRITATHASVVAAMRERPLAIREIEAIMEAELSGVEIPPNRSLWRHISGALPMVLVPYPQEAYGRARYVTAEHWLGADAAQHLDPGRAVAHLAERYLAAFGPATADDLAAYVGRGKSVKPYRAAVEELGGRLVTFVDDDGRQLVDLASAPRPDDDTSAPPRLLARWDSLLLAYGTKDRARVLPPKHQAKVITRNADVLPSFLVDGFVAGTWLPRRNRDGSPDIELRPFGRLRAADRAALEAEAHRLLPVLRDGAFSRYPGTD
ncbi:MAG TPA: winged helix DNA-binding domain-containing protein [Candidatus Limnocylindria bacterium]|nr:winged helix DNA-binding domain-containing protein [Candidatus Limnocylindria bacterium]